MLCIQICLAPLTDLVLIQCHIFPLEKIRIQ